MMENFLFFCKNRKVEPALLKRRSKLADKDHKKRVDISHVNLNNEVVSIKKKKKKKNKRKKKKKKEKEKTGFLFEGVKMLNC